MTTATGIPEFVEPRQITEDEPLLGRVGDVAQPRMGSLLKNLTLGTAMIAQVGAILLVAATWAAVFLMDLTLFSAHPLLNSIAILFLLQSILVLQPTHTPEQKRNGANVHALFILLAMLSLLGGLIVIEYNKIRNGAVHFKSAHAKLGIAVYAMLVLQTLVGFTQFYTPMLYGSVANAKVIYKYHRMSGYLLLVLLLASFATATQTYFNLHAIHIKLWVVLVTSALILIGVVPRIKKQKFGFSSSK
ncbi:Bgt-2092 [Blumeria graminis f. sp. tritici]|uniref:Cytochrome b561 domain-containing protein n=3 Tax=Blumeria graminis f. sp. tritici TaxID=62690 RepID=A0A656KR42_BLUGR|nr:hypothetical protein BGT96224_2092 [Blumeria graminis f. sp. tritici 96224]VCU40034.1 Bgt-2092 [Blumeria graminis f. sp. tritici]